MGWDQFEKSDRKLNRKTVDEFAENYINTFYPGVEWINEEDVT